VTPEVGEQSEPGGGERVDSVQVGTDPRGFESPVEVEDSRVRAALERLADIDGLPVAEQVEVFADVHSRLSEALGSTDG
jgi:hypothetical protein